jgi:hypothetical protein
MATRATGIANRALYPINFINGTIIYYSLSEMTIVGKPRGEGDVLAWAAVFGFGGSSITTIWGTPFEALLESASLISMRRPAVPLLSTSSMTIVGPRLLLSTSLFCEPVKMDGIWNLSADGLAGVFLFFLTGGV